MKRISLFTFFIFLGIAGCMAQVSGEKIEKVYVAFKTHLMWDLLILVPL